MFPAKDCFRFVALEVECSCIHRHCRIEAPPHTFFQPFSLISCVEIAAFCGCSCSNPPLQVLPYYVAESQMLSSLDRLLDQVILCVCFARVFVHTRVV